jgi:hypothetical protein
MFKPRRLYMRALLVAGAALLAPPLAGSASAAVQGTSAAAPAASSGPHASHHRVLTGAAAAAALARRHLRPGIFTQWWDSFEGNPVTRWQGLASGDGRTGFDYNLGFARTGANNGWLYAVNGSTLERTAVNLSGFGDTSSCAAGMYMEPVGGIAQVSFQVWNPGTNPWTLIAWSGNVWINPSSYQLVAIGNLDLRGYSTVYVQGAFGNYYGPAHYVRLDDAILQCGS